MMKRLSPNLLAIAICSATALLAGCNDSNDDNNTSTTPAASSETVKGTAATGKAFVGKVEIINSKGEKSSAVNIKADGTFEVTVPKGAPYLIKASNKDSGGGVDAPLIDLYSYLADASKAVNVTQLTTQAVYDANGQTNLENLYKDWATSYTRLTEEKLLAAAKRVAANLDTVLAAKFTAAGVDSKTMNVFTIPFTAAHGTTAGTGLDKVLDGVTISGFNSCNAGGCTISYSFFDATYVWKYDISTTGYNITFNGGGTGPIGSGQKCTVNMDYSYSINGFSGNANYKICYDNFPANAACSAGNGTLSNILSNFSIPGATGSVKINKYTYSAVASCPADAIKVAYNP